MVKFMLVLALTVTGLTLAGCHTEGHADKGGVGVEVAPSH